MKTKVVYVLGIFWGITHVSTTSDLRTDCNVGSVHRWPPECEGIQIQAFYQGRYTLNYSLPSGIPVPCNVTATECLTDNCSCNCSCGPGGHSSVTSYSPLPVQKSILSNIPHNENEEGCFQFTVYHEGRVALKSCCVLFPGKSESFDVEITEYKTIMSSPTQSAHQPQIPENTVMLPLVFALFVILCVLVACFVWRYKSLHQRNLNLVTTKDCRLPVLRCPIPLDRILLFYTNQSRIFKNQVKILQTILKELLKCTIIDVNECQGEILDDGCLETFMKQFDKVLLIFPRSPPAPVSNLAQKFFCHFLQYESAYPKAQFLAVSLESFLMDPDLHKLASVFMLPTKMQDLLHELNSSHSEKMSPTVMNLLLQLQPLNPTN